mmetsp:Transcript_13744/g.20027  ORF Transcript_13744/g.20027 Transcript_13744/m.20027 type:complete len:150 (+) Transcript_13744:77-526(+)
MGLPKEDLGSGNDDGGGEDRIEDLSSPRRRTKVIEVKENEKDARITENESKEEEEEEYWRGLQRVSVLNEERLDASGVSSLNDSINVRSINRSGRQRRRGDDSWARAAIRLTGTENLLELAAELQREDGNSNMNNSRNVERNEQNQQKW